MNILGRVTTALASERGTDVAHAITVPAQWLLPGTTLVVQLPRLLPCVACEGGGCDACRRQGAVALRPRGEPADVVRVSLSAGMENNGSIIRIPEHGGPSQSPDVPRGCLLLRITPGELSEGVSRELQAEAGAEATDPRWWRVAFVALLVTLLLAALVVGRR